VNTTDFGPAWMPWCTGASQLVVYNNMTKSMDLYVTCSAGDSYIPAFFVLPVLLQWVSFPVYI
jgi:hypothetical protein